MTEAVTVPVSSAPLTGTAVGPFETQWGYVDGVAEVTVWIVTLAAGAVELTADDDYSLVDGADPLSDGGAVTLDAGVVPAGGWLSGSTVVLTRATPLDQPTPLNDLAALPPQVLEAMINRQARQLQDLRAVAARSVGSPPGEAGHALPPRENLKGALLRGSAATGDLEALTAEQAAQDFKGDPGGTAMAVGLFTALGGLSVPVGTDLIQTSGYAAVGVGAARYRLVDAGPATLWRKQTENGRWFEIAEDWIGAAMVGAVGDGSNEVVALQAMLDAHVALGTTGAALAAGATYTLATGLVATGAINLAGFGATLQASADITILTASFSGSAVADVTFKGTATTFAASGLGFLASGVVNGVGVAPTFITDIRLTSCRFENLRYGGIWLKYVDRWEVYAPVVRNCGYFGIETVGAKNGEVLYPDIDGLAGENSGLNAYGVSFGCNDNSTDFIRYPSSTNCWSRGGRMANIPWHGWDTHGGVDCGVENLQVTNCRRAAIITSRDDWGPVRCVIRGVRALNTAGLNDTYSNGTEKRAEAFWVFGDADTNDVTRAYGNAIEDCYAKGYGARTSNYGALAIGYATDTRFDRITLDQPLYSGLVGYAGVRGGRVRDVVIIDPNSPGVAFGGTDVPRYVDVNVSGSDVFTMPLDSIRCIRRNPGSFTFCGVTGVFIRNASGVLMTVRDVRFDPGITTPWDIRSPVNTVLGDVNRAVTLTLTGCATSPTGSAKVTQLGRTVTVDLPAIAAVSNATTATLTGLPTSLAPAAARKVIITGTDNSVAGFLTAVIGTDGVITLGVGAGSAAFTAANNKGVIACSFTYGLDNP